MSATPLDTGDLNRSDAEPFAAKRKVGREQAGGRMFERVSAAVPDHRHDGDGTMTAAIAIPGNTASTFLTHFFGGGLADDRYVVNRSRCRRR